MSNVEEARGDPAMQGHELGPEPTGPGRDAQGLSSTTPGPQRPPLASSGIPVPAGGNFQGRRARRPPRDEAREADGRLGRTWSTVSRYDRRAAVTATEMLTSTGTLRLRFDVVDDRPFSFEPGNFVGIEIAVPGLGFRRSPYCIASAPGTGRSFDLLVRVVPDGPLSLHLAGLRPGDEVAFRGPAGRSMVPPDLDHDLVLLATGVGVGPFLVLADYLPGRGFDRRIDLYWGLRSPDDLVFTDELRRLRAAHPSFGYEISLSRPPVGWAGLQGRLTESVPPRLGRLDGKRFYLCGNGVMIAEMAAALADLGVPRGSIYEEAYFDTRHVADPQTVAAIRARFTADARPAAVPNLDAWLSGAERTRRPA